MIGHGARLVALHCTLECDGEFLSYYFRKTVKSSNFVKSGASVEADFNVAESSDMPMVSPNAGFLSA